MKCRYEKKYIISPSDCDHTSRLGMPETFDLFMDIAAEHAERIGVGATFMMEKGMFWLTAKTRIHIYKRPFMMKEVNIETWPLKPRSIQEIRDYRITDDTGFVYAEGKTQWAMLDLKTGGLIKFDKFFPMDIDFVDEPVLEEPFAKISEDITDCEEYASYKVRSSDIDLGGHMNNAAYVKALFGTFSTKELNELKIKDCEVCFKNSCYEGDELVFYRRAKDGHLEIVVKNQKDEVVILAELQ